MAPTTRICSFLAGSAAVISAVAIAPSASALVDDRLDRFVQAWAASVSADDSAAAAHYALLLNKEPDNPAFSSRLWHSAIRSDDRKKALRAARILQLRGDARESILLLFANAVQRGDRGAAQGAINSLTGGPYEFLAPLMEAWLRVSKGRGHEFPLQPKNQLLAFYSVDQRAYLNMALGDVSAAKISLNAFSDIDTDYARSLRIRAAPAMSAFGEKAFAAELLDGLLPPAMAQGQINDVRPRRIATINADDGISALYSRLAGALMDQNLPDKALMLARFANWLAPHNDVAKLTLARALEAQKLPNAAELKLSEIISASPYWSQANIRRIQAHLQGGREEAALRLAKAAVAQRKTPEMLVLLGQAQQATGDLQSAERSFLTLIAGSKDGRVRSARLAVYHLYLATVLEEQGRWSEAREYLETGIKIDPDNPYIINFLAYTLLEKNEEVEKALGLLKQAHRLEPSSPAITDSLGWGYFLTGDYKNAVRFLEKAARGPLDDFVINEHLGDAYWRSGRFVDARYAWRTASLVAGETDKARLARKIDLGLDLSARKN